MGVGRGGVVVRESSRVEQSGVCMCVHVCICVCVHMCVYMCMCVCACVCVCVCVCVCSGVIGCESSRVEQSGEDVTTSVVCGVVRVGGTREWWMCV